MKFIFPLIALALAAVGWRIVAKFAVPARIRRRYRKMAEEHLPYPLGESLGMGRSGVVFAIEDGGEKSRGARGGDGQERVIKIAHAAKAQRSATTTARMNKIKDALAPSKAVAAGAIATILEAGAIEVGSETVPYQIYRRVRGETLEAMLDSGALGRRPQGDAITLLLRVLDCAALLEEDDLYFIHLDSANVMIDAGGKACLIDPDEIECDYFSSKGRKRYLRRVCRLALEVLEAGGEGPTKLEADPDGKRFIEKLKVHRETPKGREIAEDDRIQSLAEIQEGLKKLEALAKA